MNLPSELDSTGIDDLKNRYRLIAKLGSGGMADIFLGVQLGEQNFERLVVIKKIHAHGLDMKNVDAVKMFIDEARTVATLNHPHIVKVFDLNRLKDDIIITMEYVDGETVAYLIKTLIKDQKSFPLNVSCRLILQACEALQYAHSATTPGGKPLGLIHRDIDPQNLMLDSNGYLKIIDFGVAKTTSQTEMTAPGMFKGKVSYVAPDVFRFKDIDHRVDVYSLGLVFYAMLTKKKPFPFKKDVTVAEIIERVLKEPLPPPSMINPEVPRELDEIIARAIHKERDKRYQSAEEFSEALELFSTNKVGIATTAEVKNWFRAEFDARIAQRREFERKALKKAKEMGKLDPAVAADPSRADLRTTTPGMRGTAADELTFPTQSASGLTTDLPPTGATSNSMAPMAQGKSGNPYLILLFAFILFAGGAVLVQQLFFSSSDKPPVPEVHPGDNLFVTSMPSGADLYINGKPTGTTGATGTSLKIEPGKVHMITIRKEGFEPYEISVLGDASDKREIFAQLTKKETQDSAGNETQDSASKPTDTQKTAGEEAVADAGDDDRGGRKRVVWRRNRAPEKSDNSASDDKQDDDQGGETGQEASTGGKVETSSEPTEKTSQESAQQKERNETTASRSPTSSSSSSSSSSKTTAAQATSTSSAGSSQSTTTSSQASTSSRPSSTSPQRSASSADSKPSKRYLSGDGNWSGPEVFGKGCRRCHGSRARPIHPSKKTKTQWRYFFSREQHRPPLNNYFSKDEIKRVASYILSKAF